MATEVATPPDTVCSYRDDDLGVFMWLRRKSDRPEYGGKACSECVSQLPSVEKADLGDVWQCDNCGLLWRVYEDMWNDYWWPAGWWTRFVFWVSVGPRRIA